MSRRAAIGEHCVGAALLAALSCARIGYESAPEGPLNPLPNVTHGGPLGGSGGASAGGEATSTSGSGSTDSNIDAGATDGNRVVDAGDANGGATAGGCEPAVPSVTWAFASDPQGWQVEVDPGATGNLSWAAAAGDPPAPGALELEAAVNSPGNARIYLERSASDLTGRVIYARVFLESGAGALAKVYVQTGSNYAWADGDQVTLAAQQWHCVSFDLRDPDVRTPLFDPTVVRTIGVMIFGAASPRLYVDQIAY